MKSAGMPLADSQPKGTSRMAKDSFSGTPTAPAPAPLGARYLRAAMDWQIAVGSSVLLTQRAQWEMFAAWLRATAAAQRELMDQWVCRFSGGVPLDG